ncbi:hypothetical protein [Nocardia brasiliensis]|uniref:hypothetical protein n=1 Tax=Nocardia brasiliensis TaxID=37326 RepID=UPI00366B4DF7
MTGLVSESASGNANLDSVEILDCTLRDGSYAVDFQFTREMIRGTLTGLEHAGIQLIELGHGLGLNAGEALAKASLVPDEHCFEIAEDSLEAAEWGMFCIPGIAKPAHLRQAAVAGMRFVRIGVDITEVAPAQEFIELAGELGLRAFTNLMKTNVLSVDGVTNAVQQCEKFGADAIYLVDSVGGFLPQEVGMLIEHICQAVDVPIGFHGHDNLCLANANALAAANAGARYIDTTLDGIGRYAGNANTEALSAVLWNHTNHPKYDYRALSKLSETLIRPLSRLHHDRTYQLVGGLTQTHSNFFHLITQCAKEGNVDVFDLMSAVAAIDRVNPTKELIMNAASALPQSPTTPTSTSTSKLQSAQSAK